MDVFGQMGFVIEVAGVLQKAGDADSLNFAYFQDVNISKVYSIKTVPIVEALHWNQTSSNIDLAGLVCNYGEPQC